MAFRAKLLAGITITGNKSYLTGKGISLFAGKV